MRGAGCSWYDGGVKRVLVVVGTRPEAVKLAPVVRAAQGHRDLTLQVCWTGQHAGLVQPHAHALGASPPVGPARGARPEVLLARVRRAIETAAPHAVVAQGDTGSVVAAAEAAAACGTPFVHVEAGLRTGDLAHPWPEEGNRVRIARLATLHLAPTRRARQHLVDEGIEPRAIVVTGNTIVDAVQRALSGLGPDAPTQRLRGFSAPRTRVLFTHHRRESLPRGAAEVVRGVAGLADAFPGLEILMPSHPNPAVQEVLTPLQACPNVRCLPPLRHRELLWLLGRCRFAITDSGGIQEEAPSLQVPVLVTRHRTERPEALERGWAELVGWDARRLQQSAGRWLEDDDAYAQARPWCNPFGDGHAADRCVQALRCLLGLSTQAPAAWTGPAIAA